MNSLYGVVAAAAAVAALVQVSTTAVYAQGSSETGAVDCDVYLALMGEPGPGCETDTGAPPASTDDAAPALGRTRGLAIGGSAPAQAPPVQPTEVEAAVPLSAAVGVAPPVKPTVPPTGSLHPGRPAAEHAVPTSVAMPGAGVQDTAGLLADVRSLLIEVKEEQERLAAEQAHIKELIGLTKLREIGRLDGRIDQLTALVERLLRRGDDAASR